MVQEVSVTAIQSRLPMPQGLDEMDARKWRVLCESTFPNAKTAEAIVMALDYCKARNLDIFKRPVNIVPMWNKSLGKEVETVWPGINEVQVTAARTGEYAGMDEPKWGADKSHSFSGVVKFKDGSQWKEEALKVDLTFPESCSVTVYRIVKGQRCAFTEPVFWLEAYARRGKTDVPNDMWAKRPRGQLLKVAKAFSLRAAFPEEGEYVAEEMEGKEVDSGGVVIEHAPIVKSCFKNAALRKAFQQNVCDAFHKAQSIKELQELMTLDLEKLGEMDASGNEYDALALDEIRKQYKLAYNRLLAGTREDSGLDGDEPTEDDLVAAGLVPKPGV